MSQSDRPWGRLAIFAAMAVTVAMTVDAERGPFTIAFVLLGCIYLYKGYRGTRWLFAGYLIWLALLAGAEVLRRASRGLDPVVLHDTVTLIVGFATATVLVASRNAAGFLSDQLDNRTPATGQFITALWIILLAVIVVVLWVDVGFDVLF